MERTTRNVDQVFGSRPAWSTATALAGGSPGRNASRGSILNQTYVEDVHAAPTLEVDDPMAVFNFVLGKPARARQGLSDRELLLLPVLSTAASATPATSGSTSSTATRARCTSPISRTSPNGRTTRTRSPTACSTRPRREASRSSTPLVYRVSLRRQVGRVRAQRSVEREAAAGRLRAGRDLYRADLRRVRDPLLPGLQPQGSSCSTTCSTRPSTVADQFVAGGRHRPHPDRQAHRLRLLSRPPARPQNPDRRVRGQFARQQLLRRTVRPAAGQFHRRRDPARGDPGGRAGSSPARSTATASRPTAPAAT